MSVGHDRASPAGCRREPEKGIVVAATAWSGRTAEPDLYGVQSIVARIQLERGVARELQIVFAAGNASRSAQEVLQTGGTGPTSLNAVA